MNPNLRLPWWIVVGRLTGDDEDTLHIVKAATEGGATDEFERRLLRADPSGHHRGVALTYVVWCGMERPTLAYKTERIDDE